MNPISTGLGIVLLVAGLGLALTYNRLNNCVEERAALHQQVVDLETKVLEQNKKVEEWQKRSSDLVEASRKALEAQREAGRRLEGEIARLKAASAKPPVSVSGCPAGSAVLEIRKGLK